jgi:hypothetical protein
MKIGITFDPSDTPIDIFSNGIKQNAIFFHELLSDCGYDVYFIIIKGKEDRLLKLYGIDENVKYSFYEDILNSNFNLIFQFTTQLSLQILKDLKKSGTKLILYKCGNDYVMDLEDVLHDTERNRFPQYIYMDEKIFDEIWSIPQHETTNFHYWKTLYRCDVKIVKPVWSPKIIQVFESVNGKDFLYKKRTGKKIAIFEPNLNVVKWFYPALLVCENAYRLVGDEIKFVYVTNIPDSNKKFDIDLVNEIVKSLDLYKDKKISIEARYNSLIFMSSFADICVSHQWENPLNYLYLDLAWYGWPVVHNAHICKDVGYYYKDFDYKQGGEVLSKVIKKHDSNDKYLSKNRKLLERYLPSNKSVQQSYKKLIDGLFI